MKIKVDIEIEIAVPEGEENKTRDWYEAEHSKKMDELREQVIKHFGIRGANDVVKVTSKIIESTEESGSGGKYYFITFTDTTRNGNIYESSSGNAVIDMHPVEWLRILNKSFSDRGEEKVYTGTFYQEIDKEQYESWKETFEEDDE